MQYTAFHGNIALSSFLVPVLCWNVFLFTVFASFSSSQAANDGLRGLYMHCFDGPDRGKGFVVLSNGDNPAVMFQCELCRALLKGWLDNCLSGVLWTHKHYIACGSLIGCVQNTVLSCFRLLIDSSVILWPCMLFLFVGLAYSGVDYSRYKDSDLVYDIANMKQETIVNRGKLLVITTV